MDDDFKYLWIVHYGSRHIDNRFTFIKPTEKIGDLCPERDPWGFKVYVTKIDKYKLVGTIGK